MKVIATGYQQERLIIDEVDAITASMTASVLNELYARAFADNGRLGEHGWFYSAQPDTYELRS